MSSQTSVASFVLRFVQETTADATAEFPKTELHAVIKHVQSNSEQHFTRVSDAVAFIANYVDFGVSATTEPSAIQNAKTQSSPNQARVGAAPRLRSGKTEWWLYDSR